MSAPRSAFAFPAIKADPIAGFAPTHRRVPTGAPVEVMQRQVYTYPTVYPGLVLRDDTGRHFFVTEQTFTEWDKKHKCFVNYEPVEARP